MTGVEASTAYDQLAARLRAQIMSGELPEGARLPSEASLAEETGVSRSTVREALRTLQEGGFVERASPRVMVVRRHHGDPAAGAFTHALRRERLTFRHLLEALTAIEPELSRLAAARAPRDDLAALQDNLRRQAAAVEDFDEWNRLDEAFHLEIARVGGNPALGMARRAITPLLLPTTSRFVRTSRMTSAALEFHHRILAEIEAGEPDGAALMTRAHVNDFGRAWERAGLDLDLTIGAV